MVTDRDDGDLSAEKKSQGPGISGEWLGRSEEDESSSGTAIVLTLLTFGKFCTEQGGA